MGGAEVAGGRAWLGREGSEVGVWGSRALTLPARGAWRGAGRREAWAGGGARDSSTDGRRRGC